MVEFLGGNEKYRKTILGARGRLATSVMNLAELYFVVLREFGVEAADESYTAFGHYEASIKAEDVKNGMALRLESRRQRTDLSYADAIGYAISRRLGAKFLTGDRAFYSLPSVEMLR